MDRDLLRAVFRAGEAFAFDREEPHASPALAVVGDMLQESEHDLEIEQTRTGRNYIGQRIAILRDVRDRIEDAERASREELR